MTAEWQSWAAPAVVVATLGIMVVRLWRRKKAQCQSDCGCGGRLLKTKQGPGDSANEIRYRTDVAGERSRNTPKH